FLRRARDDLDVVAARDRHEGAEPMRVGVEDDLADGATARGDEAQDDRREPGHVVGRLAVTLELVRAHRIERHHERRPVAGLELRTTTTASLADPYADALEPLPRNVGSRTMPPGQPVPATRRVG